MSTRASNLPLCFRRTIRRYTKFLIVGVVNAAVDLGILNLLMVVWPVRSPFWLTVYNSVAVVCAIANSYVWNRHWTFADRADGSLRERAWFAVQALINLALNDLIVVWLSTYLVFDRSVPLFISSNASKGLAMLLSSSASFLLMRCLVFRRRTDPGAHPAQPAGNR